MTGPPRPGRRLPAAERRRAIVEAATRLFAGRGFAVTTRDIAAELGITQALLYKHFASKEALVEAVFEATFVPRWSASFEALLADRSRPLADRLVDLYMRLPAADDGLSLRLFLRAALDGYPVALRRGGMLTGQVLAPVVAELRHEAGLPPLAAEPMTAAERELAMMLHAAVTFHAIRVHVYRAVPPGSRPATLALYAETFLAGARAIIRALPRPG